MSATDLAIDVARRFEGCKLTAYWDRWGKVWTIGWGHTGPDVHEGLVIDQDRADELLARDMGKAEMWCYRLLPVPLADHQRAALCDFTFNLGSAKLRSSTLRKKILRGDIEGAAEEFPKWKFSGGKILSGLVARRAVERALFLG